MDAPSAPNTEGGMPPPGGEGGIALPSQPPTPWTAQLADESLRAHPGLTKFKDMDSLAKSYVELDKLRNERTGVKPLTEQSTADEIAAYRTAMGIPDKPDAYDLGDLSYPDVATPTEAQMASFRQMAHTLHLTPAQLQGVLKWHSTDTSAQVNAMRDTEMTDRRTTDDALKKEHGAQWVEHGIWGKDFVKHRWGEEGLEALGLSADNRDFGTSPLLMKMLVDMARLTGHDRPVMAEGGGAMMDATVARQKYDELWGQRGKATNENEREAIDRQIAEIARRAFS